MKTFHIESTVLSAALLTSALVAQGAGSVNGGLLYTTRFDETSNQCVAAAAALNDVRANDIQYLEPNPGAVTRSFAYYPYVGQSLVMGDHDVDGEFHEPNVFGRLDAVLHPRKRNGSRITLDKTRVFHSATRLEPNATGAILGADVSRLLPGGDAERFLSIDQVRTAFGVPAGATAPVDAIMLYMTPNGGGGGGGGGDVFLSFEGAQTIDIPPFGTITVDDGAVLGIPNGAISWTTSAYDGAILVDSVAANSGYIAFSEADMDAFAQASGIRDNAGALVVNVEDLDGLTPDPRGGFQRSQWTNRPIPNFWFSAEKMSGGGVVSTVGGGQIAVLNGQPLGSAAAATTGAQVGLVSTSVESLAGLALTDRGVSPFSLDTGTPEITGAGLLEVEVGGAPGAVQLMLDLGCSAVGCIDPNIFVGTAGFPVLYPTSFGPIVPVAADGCGRIVVPVSAAVHAALLGQTIEFQAFVGSGGGPGQLTNPLKIHFK